MAKKIKEMEIVNDQVIVSAQVASKVFGITVRTLNDWTKKGCPKVEKGVYNLREVMEWRHSANNSPESLEAKKQKADIRYREARADMEEMKRKTMVGELVAVEDIEHELVEVFSRIKMGLLNIKQKVLQELHSSYPECAFEVSSIVEREVEKGLHTLGKTRVK